MLRLLAIFLGPIFAKEAVEIARRKRYYLNRLVYGTALFTALLIIWIENSGRLRSLGAIRGMSRIASEIFLAVNIIQFAAVFLFVPLFLCAVLAGEREEKTLDLLFTTQLRNSQIVLGKLFSRLAAMGLLILCSLPVLSLLMLWGGVDPSALVRSLFSTLLAAAFVGSHAIYFSTITRSPLGALVRTYWWLAAELVLIPFVIFLPVVECTPGPTHPAALVYLGTLLLTNPIAVFSVGVDGFLFNQMVITIGWWIYPTAYVIPSLASVFLCWRAVCCLRHEPTPFRMPLAGSALVRGVRGLVKTAGAVWQSAWSWVPTPTQLVLYDRGPFELRARQAFVYDREGHIRRVQTLGMFSAFVVIGLVALLEPGDLNDDEVCIGFLAVIWGGFCLLSALVAGASLAGDRRRGFLELVLVTPLTGREVLDGTMLAVWVHVRQLLWLPLLFVPFFCLTEGTAVHGGICSFITASLFLAVLILHGVGCSLPAQSMPGALVATFAFPVVALGVTGLMIAVFEEHHGLVLWPLTVLLLAGTWGWARLSASCAAVSAFLTASYLALACLFSCWTYNGRADEWPAAAMHPGFLSLVTMDRRFEHEFRGAPWPIVMVTHWTALILHFYLARRWLIHHFDRLAGRAVVDVPVVKSATVVTPAASPQALVGRH